MSTKEAEGDNVCPTCSGEFSSNRGMKIHHKKAHGESIAGVACECAVCGGDFLASPSESPHRDFCSEECQNQWQSQSGIHHGENNPQWDGGDVIVVCEWCGGDYEVVPAKADNSRFCSRACMGEWRSENISGPGHPQWSGRVGLKCENCGCSFERIPSQSEARFCSQACMGEWMSDNLVGENSRVWIDDRIPTVCEVCGKEYERLPHHSNSRYCSLECMGEYRAKNWVGEDHPGWKGGSDVPDYGPLWTEERREYIRETQNRQCADCGVPDNFLVNRLHVHHILPVRDNPTALANQLWNLVALCPGCHRRWEGEPTGKQRKVFGKYAMRAGEPGDDEPFVGFDERAAKAAHENTD